MCVSHLDTTLSVVEKVDRELGVLRLPQVEEEHFAVLPAAEKGAGVGRAQRQLVRAPPVEPQHDARVRPHPRMKLKRSNENASKSQSLGSLARESVAQERGEARRGEGEGEGGKAAAMSLLPGHCRLRRS